MPVTETPAQTGTATPAALRDSLLDLVDQAHVEDATTLADGAALQSATVPTVSLASPAKERVTTPKETTPKAADANATLPKDEADAMTQKYKEQRVANQRLGTEVKAYQAKIAQLEAKLNGTYQEPTVPTQEEETKLAEFRGREAASRRMAEEQYGEETVLAQIYAKESPYNQLIAAEPWLHARTARADRPVEEALRILRERKVYDDLGPDPDKWEAAMVEKLRPAILAELKAQAAAGQTLVGKAVPGVGTARGMNDERRSATLEEEFSLSSMGSHFLD